MLGWYRLLLMKHMHLFVILSGALLTAALSAVTIGVRANIAAPLVSVPDNFGYVYDDAQPYAWIDITGDGDDAGFEGQDDDFIGPIPLGFDFKFYEYTYSELFITTNGILTFGSGSSIFENKPIPNTGPPNAYIAPLWDDLAVGGDYNDGKVFYRKIDDARGRYFVVEWYNVTRSGNLTDVMTFEAFLYENGNICYQYADLNGTLDSATIGIEDGDGVDGLAYLTDQSGLEDLVGSRGLCFIRPEAGSRTKALPIYQSGFTQGKPGEYQVLARNTGEMGADTYDINVAESDPEWSISLYNADDRTPLTDTDNDGIVDSGPVDPGMSRPFLVKVQTPTGAEVGSYTVITLTLSSSLDPDRQATAQIQTAVPAHFSQAYADITYNMRGVYLQRILPTSQDTYQVSSDFTGSTMSLASSKRGRYFLTWERSGVIGTVYFIDVEYTLLDAFGRSLHPVEKLTSNENADLSTTDRYPALAVSATGWIGVIWVRDIYDGDQVNSNVYMAILAPDGEVSYGPYNITQNAGWRSGDTIDIPTFTDPRIVSIEDDRFLFSWVDDRLQSGGETSRVFYAVYNVAGVALKPPDSFTPGIAGGIRSIYPALAELDDGKVLVSYSALNPVESTFTIMYAIIDRDGNLVLDPTAIPESDGWKADAVQSSDGKVVLAWTRFSEGQIVYAMLDNTYALVAGPVKLDSPYRREPDNVSVTNDQDGHVILTWLDAEWSDYLYYALIDADGNLMTPPMIFRTGQAVDPLLVTSYTGEGNTQFVTGVTCLPAIFR
jgi:hypothetical protein